MPPLAQFRRRGSPISLVLLEWRERIRGNCYRNLHFQDTLFVKCRKKCDAVMSDVLSIDLNVDGYLEFQGSEPD